MIQPLKAPILRVARFLPDKPYVYLFFWVHTGKILHLKNPQFFTRKLQWLKIYGNMEQFAEYADKYTVRSYVEKTIGKEHLIPLIGAWDTFDEIPFDKLPKKFVLKVSNGCEYNYICKNKADINMAELKKTIESWQRENFFYRLEREAQYKTATSKIVCEKYMEDDSGSLRDYKFHCSQGIAKYVQIDIDRFNGHRSEVRTLDWKPTPHQAFGEFDDIGNTVPKPKNFKQMVTIAEKLSKPFPYVRVDLYVVNDKIYFGELTFTPGSGIVEQQPINGEIAFGKMVDLSLYAKPLNI